MWRPIWCCRSWTFWCCCCPLHWPHLTVEQFSSSRIPAARSRSSRLVGIVCLEQRSWILVSYPVGDLKGVEKTTSGWFWLRLYVQESLLSNQYNGLLQDYLNTIHMDGSDKEPYQTSFLKRHTSICLANIFKLLWCNSWCHHRHFQWTQVFGGWWYYFTVHTRIQTWYVYIHILYIYIHHSDQLTIINPIDLVLLVSKTHQDCNMYHGNPRVPPCMPPPTNLIFRGY